MCKNTNYFYINLHILILLVTFTQSFCDKYATLYKMGKEKTLTPEQIKAIKANKIAIINANQTVNK